MADRVFPGSGINSFLRYDISETDWGYTKEKDLSAATIKGIVDGAVSAIKLPKSISDIPELKVTPSPTVVFPNPSINGITQMSAGNLMRQEGFRGSDYVNTSQQSSHVNSNSIRKISDDEVLRQRLKIMKKQNATQLEGFAMGSPLRLGANIPVETNPNANSVSKFTIGEAGESKTLSNIASNEAIVIIIIFIFAILIAVIMYGTMKYMNAIEVQTDKLASYDKPYDRNSYENTSYVPSENTYSRPSEPTVDSPDQEMEFFGA